MEQGRDGDGEQLQIGPHVGLAADPQGQELAVRIQSHFRRGHVIAAMGVREESL